MNMVVKEFWKSVHICQSYDKKSSVLFFLRHSVQCTVAHCSLWEQVRLQLALSIILANVQLPLVRCACTTAQHRTQTPYMAVMISSQSDKIWKTRKWQLCYPLSQISSIARKMPSMLSMRARFSTFFRSMWLTASYKQLRTLTSMSCNKHQTRKCQPLFKAKYCWCNVSWIQANCCKQYRAHKKPMWPWPLTLTFNRLLQVVKVHVHGTFQQVKRSSS